MPDDVIGGIGIGLLPMPNAFIGGIGIGLLPMPNVFIGGIGIGLLPMPATLFFNETLASTTSTANANPKK